MWWDRIWSPLKKLSRGPGERGAEDGGGQTSCSEREMSVIPGGLLSDGDPAFFPGWPMNSEAGGGGAGPTGVV